MCKTLKTVTDTFQNMQSMIAMIITIIFYVMYNIYYYLLLTTALWEWGCWFSLLLNALKLRKINSRTQS